MRCSSYQRKILILRWRVFCCSNWFWLLYPKCYSKRSCDNQTRLYIPFITPHFFSTPNEEFPAYLESSHFIFISLTDILARKVITKQPFQTFSSRYRRRLKTKKKESNNKIFFPTRMKNFQTNFSSFQTSHNKKNFYYTWTITTSIIFESKNHSHAHFLLSKKETF